MNRSKHAPDPWEDLSESTLARAEIVLSILSQKAAAAKAEAQCAELRLLLVEARAGNSQRLARWLALHHAEALPPTSHAARTQPAEALQPTSDAPRTQPVEQPHALSRSSQVAGPVNAAGPMNAAGPKNATRPANAAGLTKSQLAARNAAKPRAAPAPPPGALTRQPAPRVPTTAAPKHRRQRLRGIVASSVAHTVLVLLLGLITLRMPAPPASLALESVPVEPLTETLELTQPLELEPSDMAAEPDAPSESMDVAESLDAVRPTLSEGLGDLSQQPVSLMASATDARGMQSASSIAKSFQTNATFFGASASGNCFCYVIDGSESMRDGPWAAAKLELLKSLASLTPKQRFYIVFFNQTLSAIPRPGELQAAPYTLYATAENLQHARRWIDSLRIDLGAPPKDALQLAISKEPDAIYLLTDGVTKSDVSGFLRQHNRADDLIFGEQVRVPIHTIAFYSLEGQKLLRQIAAENNGQFVYVPDPRQR